MQDESMTALIDLLESAVRSERDLGECIRQLQTIVWADDAEHSDEGAWEIFRDLAHDLDFFEPNPAARAEDASFFGEDRAREEIRVALRRLHAR